MLIDFQFVASVLGGGSALMALITAYNSSQRRLFAQEREILHMQRDLRAFSGMLEALDQNVEELTLINLECRNAVSILLGKSPTFPPES